MMEVLMPITLKSSDQHNCLPATMWPHIEKITGQHVGSDHKGQDRKQLFPKIFMDNKQI